MKTGIIGAGKIAAVMAGTILRMDTAECVAVAARELSKARKFADEYHIPRAYGSYDELLADPEVELVYIALPHSHHHLWTINALKAGKHVLCEKAFAVNEEEAAQMISLAGEKHLLLAEAIWTRYMPSRQIICDLVESGVIGEVTAVTANLGYKIDMNERIIRPELAGGALLDLTVYPLNFASMILGDDIAHIDAVCTMTDTGVDAQDSVTLRYSDGKIASLFSSIYVRTDRRGIIYGRNGYIEVENINNPQKISVWSTEKRTGPELIEEITVPAQITGYEYEVDACARAIAAGLTECPEMPHSETLEIMRQMDMIRKQF